MPTVEVTDPLEEATTMQLPYCPRATHDEIANRFERVLPRRRTRRARPKAPRH
jgi:hypothetical protein